MYVTYLISLVYSGKALILAPMDTTTRSPSRMRKGIAIYSSDKRRNVGGQAFNKNSEPPLPDLALLGPTNREVRKSKRKVEEI
jgi:hypothetical protein